MEGWFASQAFDVACSRSGSNVTGLRRSRSQLIGSREIELARLDRVRQGKLCDLARVSRLIEEIEHAGHARCFTTMQMYLATLALGGSGVTLPPPAAAVIRRITEAFVAGTLPRRRAFSANSRFFRPIGWASASPP